MREAGRKWVEREGKREKEWWEERIDEKVV